MRYTIKSAPPPGGEPDEFVMSDGSIDRVGDVIEPSGWQLDRIKSPPPVLFNHDRNQIVGSWADIRVKDGKLIGRIVWTNSRWPAAQYVRDLVREGHLRTVSVGFQPHEKQPLTKQASKDFGPFRFTKSELLECSLVSVPANPNALAIARDLPRDLISEIFREPASEDSGEQRAVHAKPGKSLPVMRTKMQPQTISQKIQAAQQNIAVLRDSLNELASKDELDAEETKRYQEDLPKQIEEARRELEAHRRVERSLVDDGNSVTIERQPERREPEIMPPPTSTMPALKDDGRKLFAIPKKKVEPGEYVARALAAWTRQHVTKDPFEKVLREGYGNDEMTNLVLRAAVNPAMTTVATWAAELVQVANVDFLDRLIPNFIYPQLKAMGTSYTFPSGIGVMKIPVRAVTPAIAGAWVGEGSPKPVKRASFSTISLAPTKLSVISTFSEEMALYGLPSIEGIIRQAMADDTGIALDTYLIDNVAASAGVRPAGLLNGVTPITASAATPPLLAMVADLKALVAAITAVGGGTKVVLMMNPAQSRRLGMAQTTTGDFAFGSAADAANRFGMRLIVSATVPAGRVIAVDAADFATASGDVPRFAVSTEATLHEEDTTPLALVTGAQGSGVVATPMRSLFQTDAVAIRMSMHVTWAMRRASMVQTIASVTW